MNVTPRQRMLKAFAFDNPDKLPVFYHPSTAGLYVHGQKLLDLFEAYPPDNYITFNGIPQPPAGAFDPDGSYHEFITDAWGTTWEYRIFGIAGHPKKFPLTDYSVLDTYTFPPLPDPKASDIADLKDKFLLWAPVNVSLFERVFEIRPFEDILVDIHDNEPAFLRLLDRLLEYYREGIRRSLTAGYDVFSFGDDWGTQDSLILSPEAFRSIFKPRIAALTRMVREAGKIVMYHSCGAVEAIFDDLVELGINGFWHQIGRYDPVTFAKRCADAKVLLFLHMDRQHLVPLGTPQEIRDTVRRYADIHKKLGGGAIFYIEIENDAPFENVEALITSVHEYR